MLRFSASIFCQVPNEYPNPATVVTEALIYTWRQILYTGNIFLANSANNEASNWKMARIFLMVYKLEWKS
jgi:hypothetical protein